MSANVTKKQIVEPAVIQRKEPVNNAEPRGTTYPPCRGNAPPLASELGLRECIGRYEGSYVRGHYDEIDLGKLPEPVSEWVRTLVRDIAASEKVDEHGGWSFGIEDVGSRNSGGWASLNWDLMDLRLDHHSVEPLTIIQVRSASKPKSHYWARIRKSYFLCGRNEDGRPFAHCIRSGVVWAALNSGKDACMAAQKWIFGADYASLLRQGDVALVPIKRARKGNKCTRLLIEDSHLLTGQIHRVNGTIYVHNPRLRHRPGVHPEVTANGWHKVVVGRRAKPWEFAVETID